jgi:hypothetical protein
VESPIVAAVEDVLSVFIFLYVVQEGWTNLKMEAILDTLADGGSKLLRKF